MELYTVLSVEVWVGLVGWVILGSCCGFGCGVAVIGGCTCRVSGLFIKGFVMHSCGLSALNVGFRGGIHRGWCDRSS